MIDLIDLIAFLLGVAIVTAVVAIVFPVIWRGIVGVQ
jgi:hypothetical protein